MPHWHSACKSSVSIPSSRVGTNGTLHRLYLEIKFPSPQVGSEPPAASDQRQLRIRFHPLKSGRNYNFRVLPLLSENVSIPSSRVGTSIRSLIRANPREFPSPQVGSEQYGRKHPSNASRLFPSPQVGSEPIGPSMNGGGVMSFHPLKSGRNGDDRPLLSFEPHVSIPSSRVGTTTRLSRALIPFGFHPLKSGRNARDAGGQHSPPRSSFHPLKSGRNLRPNKRQRGCS